MAYLAFMAYDELLRLWPLSFSWVCHETGGFIMQKQLINCMYFVASDVAQILDDFFGERTCASPELKWYGSSTGITIWTPSSWIC